jgi:hypothetical protein
MPGDRTLEDALAARIVGLIEARQQGVQMAMAGDRDAQHLALDAPVEALDHAIRPGRASTLIATSWGRSSQGSTGRHLQPKPCLAGSRALAPGDNLSTLKKTFVVNATSRLATGGC